MKTMARSQKYSNDTVDVLNKGCFTHFDSIACARISVLVLISVITFLFVVLKIIKYHIYKHSLVHHYVVFYVSAIQCIICMANFLFGIHYPQLEFVANFAKLFQFILICHFYWSLAARSCHRDDIVQYVVNPVICLYVLYCTTVVLMGMVDISGTWTECFRPYWLMLTSADFIAVQLFAIVALYLTHINKQLTVSALMLPVASPQTRELWLVTAVYEISAVVSVIFDAIMAFMGQDENGCSGIYNHVQLYYSSFLTAVMIVKYFVPTWTLLCVFQPNRIKSRLSEVALASHYNMNGHRMFLPRDLGLSSCLPHLSGPLNPESPVFGNAGDFSVTDSSPESSPGIIRYWGGINDNRLNECCDKQFISEHNKAENELRIEQNRQSLERCLDAGNNVHGNMDIYCDRNLTTIREENHHNDN